MWVDWVVLLSGSPTVVGLGLGLTLTTDLVPSLKKCPDAAVSANGPSLGGVGGAGGLNSAEDKV